LLTPNVALRASAGSRKPIADSSLRLCSAPACRRSLTRASLVSISSSEFFKAVRLARGKAEFLTQTVKSFADHFPRHRLLILNPHRPHDLTLGRAVLVGVGDELRQGRRERLAAEDQLANCVLRGVHAHGRQVRRPRFVGRGAVLVSELVSVDLDQGSPNNLDLFRCHCCSTPPEPSWIARTS
jgi:hypothetical protein